MKTVFLRCPECGKKGPFLPGWTASHLMSYTRDTSHPKEEPMSLYDPEVCIDGFGEGDCGGEVERRYPLSGSGKGYPRCEKHWSERLDFEKKLRECYPEEQPDDFDPLYAGESWDED